MSFRLTDLKKFVHKTKDGHGITPAKLDGRSSTFQIDWVLSHFEEHLGRPRRELEPDALLDFLGDARLGRGILATLAQWYRMRARTFAEALQPKHLDRRWEARFTEHRIAGPVELRAWLYAAVNEVGSGFLDPDGAVFFWEAQARALGVRRAELEALTVLDRPEESVLVRTGPRPHALDVMAAYNARAHTTLLRSARHVHLRCAAGSATMEKAARAWASALEVEWRTEGGTLVLPGKADALGCWTRYGRRLEMAVLELLALPELQVEEVRGKLEAGGKVCGFAWKGETLNLLGAGSGTSLDEGAFDAVTALALMLRRERGSEGEWGVRRPACGIAVLNGFLLPHLDLRRGDWSLYLRWLGEKDTAKMLEPFHGKTPVVGVGGSVDGRLVLHLPDGTRVDCAPDAVLPLLAGWLETLPGYATVETRRAAAA